MNEYRRRREFEDQLRDADWIKQVSQWDRNGVCLAFTDSDWSETYIIWMHYSADFNWWGIAQEKRRRLRAHNGELMHAFLGRQKDEWYLVPDDKVDNLNLGKQSRRTDHYKVQTEHGRPSNREMLEHYALYKGT